MLALIEMNLLPGGKRGAARPKGRGRKPSAPKVTGLREIVRGDPWVIAVVLLTIVAVVHLLFAFFSQGVKPNQIEGRLEQERQDSVRYAEAIAAADSLSARRDTLAAKARIIREIDTDRFVWSHILDNVATALPEFNWLTALEQTSGAGRTLAA